MSSAKEGIEFAREVAPLIKMLFTSASRTMLGRLSLMATVGAISMGGVTLYNFLQVKEYSESTDSYLAEMDQAQYYNRDQKVLDHINLCINAVKAGEANKGYYCREAVALYKDTFVEIPGGKVAENIKRAAYGAMKVDMEVRIRAGKTEAQLDQKRPKLDEISAFLFTPKGLSLFCLSGIILMLGTIGITHIIHRKNTSKVPETGATEEPVSNSAPQEDQAEQHQPNVPAPNGHSA